MTSHIEQYPPNPDLPNLIAEARAHGLLIHDMIEFPGATELLAEWGLFTTTETRFPASLWEVHKNNSTERQLGRLATNTMTALRRTGNSTFIDALEDGRLAPTLIDLFMATDVHSILGLHVEDPKHKKGELVNGTVTADSITLTVDTIERQKHAFAD
jgi:hypothetical protein